MDAPSPLPGEAPWVERPEHPIALPCGRVLSAARRPLVMGILNVTPDSFADGGRFLGLAQAVEHARAMCDEGADIIDIGGESTRPGSEDVPADEELRRVIPVIKELAAQMAVPISIDTQKAQVAAAALEEGAQIINDVSALRTDPAMAPLAARTGAPVVLMHMQGRPRTMQKEPAYGEVVGEVLAWLRERVAYAVSAGIPLQKLVVDPGFGFGKRVEHNLELLRRLHCLHALGLPVMVGTSRKAMLGRILGAPDSGSGPGPLDRLNGTLATVACAVMAGCHVVRVHDVRPALEVVKVCEAVRRGIAYDNA